MQRNRLDVSTKIGTWLNPSYPIPQYQRPTDWLVLPNVSVGQQKLVGLYAVHNNHSNFASVLCAGNYTVDWGDGTSDNVSSGNKIDHLYIYADIPAYTECSRGYRQVIITITPQAGQTLTSISLQQRHSSDGNVYCTGWLDIRVAGSSITAFGVGGGTVYNRMLEQFEWVGTNSITSFSAFFAHCWSLQKVVALYTTSGTNFGQMFDGCRALREIPLLITTNCNSTMAYMFRSCKSLVTIPLLDTSNCPVFTEMFSYCDSLRTIPLLNTSKATGMAYMFYECTSLEMIPNLDVHLVTNFTQMFLDCYCLHYVNFSNVAAGTTYDSMFYNCWSLRVGILGGLNQTFTYVNCQLAREELVDIFNSLAVVVGKTLTITGNWGVASLSVAEKAIATDKGWTLSL